MRLCRFLLFLFFLPAIVSAGPLNLKVVYPVPEQALPAVDSTFIFGSVDPTAKLTINGVNVTVCKEGGWLAFLPVKPGAFQFFLKAESDTLVDTLTLPVTFPLSLPEISDSSFFIKGSFTPSQPLGVKPGDEVKLSFRARRNCRAFGLIDPLGDTVFMWEYPIQKSSYQKNVFDKNLMTSDSTADSLSVWSLYEGSYLIPNKSPESLRFIYNLEIPVVKDSTTKQLMVTETSSVSIRVLPSEHPQIVEFKDSSTVIRTGPQRGYLCINQPQGIRALLCEREGNWLKLKLSDYQFGWVNDTAVTMLAPGTIISNSYARYVRTINGSDEVSIIVNLSGKHPYRVEENPVERSLTVFLYGVNADIDWIRYDNTDSLIEQIVWSQPEPGMTCLKVYLTSDRIWGYDAYYVDDEFHFRINKHPHKYHLSDFRFVIDPGHSPDPGAIGPTGLMEKDVNLAIARQLKKELERKGATAVLTRSDDSPLPLAERPKIAVREKADIFISIHNNALPDGVNPFTNNGVSTYYYHPHSAALARSVQKALARELGLPDFGWYYANFAVDRPTQYPAILVESAFIILPEQETLLKNPKFQNRIAKAITRGVENFLRNK